jgi:hypothetical protein
VAAPFSVFIRNVCFVALSYLLYGSIMLVLNSANSKTLAFSILHSLGPVFDLCLYVGKCLE